MHKLLKNKRTIFLLVAPGLAVFIFAVFIPIIVSIYYGMTDWGGIGKPNFIGMKNFTEIIFHDEAFWYSLRNALLLGAAFVFIQHPISFIFAIMIDKIGGKLEKVFRAIFFIPCVISIIVTSKMWVSIYDPQYGLLNKVLDILQLGALKQDWLGNPKFVLPSLIVILMWQGFGWALLIYYSGLKGIPEEIYEAARIDGAGTFKIITSITIPLMKPVIRVNIILAVISALKQMETVFLTTGGGPGSTSQFLANYLFVKAFNSAQYGYGNAISVLFVIVCLVMTFVLNKMFKSINAEY
ncbi:MAG TPA: sugar ABC transporter permease [Candidatus Diapherotrites archaeon]|nr:sugar ABC transporter permease [Bacillota bacterium]HRU41878.1 sugar ABC transporter permease [Candidatus Diapherotrites archaeon]